MMHERGLSLLEMLVALSVLGLTIGALYQGASSATRNVRADERYAYAVELSRSLLADNSQVPADGVNVSDVTAGGFSWQVESFPLDTGRSGLQRGQLHAIQIRVSWADGLKDREVVLDSVVESFAEDVRP